MENTKISNSEVIDSGEKSPESDTWEFLQYVEDDDESNSVRIEYKDYQFTLTGQEGIQVESGGIITRNLSKVNFTYLSPKGVYFSLPSINLELNLLDVLSELDKQDKEIRLSEEKTTNYDSEADRFFKRRIDRLS
jgi:hypothetical protein